MKQKIAFLTEDSFWDTDISLFPHLVGKFDIHAIVIDTPGNNKYPQKTSIDGCTLSVYKRKIRMRNLINFFFAFRIFREVMRVNKTHTLLYAFNIDPYLNFLFLLFLSPKNVIVSFHNFESHSDGQKFERWGKKVILRKYNYFHFHSELQYNLFKARFPEKKSFFTTMPLKNFGKKKTNTLPKDKRVFMFFGFVRRYKKLDLLIEAFNEINAPNAILCIAGFSKEWEYYDSLIKDRSKFDLQIRFIDNEEIPELFGKADFLVLPYSDATQSGPLLTAVEYNTPVIASNIESFSAVINDGKNGFLFEPDNKKSLEQVLSKAASLPEEEYVKMKEHQLLVKEEIDAVAANSGKLFADFINAFELNKR